MKLLGTITEWLLLMNSAADFQMLLKHNPECPGQAGQLGVAVKLKALDL
jgi:hypothetical protein